MVEVSIVCEKFDAAFVQYYWFLSRYLDGK